MYVQFLDWRQIMHVSELNYFSDIADIADKSTSLKFVVNKRTRI